MRQIPSLLLLVIFALLLNLTACTSPRADDASGMQAASNPIVVMSYNIRYDNPNDPNPWPQRKDHVAELMGARYQTDLTGLQEALKHQIDDLQARLPGYAWIGVGRDDGLEGGEYSPIFYRTERFELLEEDTFWLSETPDVPGSMSWDTAITRIVSWGRFRDRQNGQEFYMFNTHFDHRGQQARLESAKLLLRRAADVPDGVPVIVTGDLNVQETSEAYAVFTGNYPGISSDLVDARYASKTGHEGPTASFNNWTELRPPETRIDYIFVRNGIDVLSHRILDDKFNGFYPSDHLPVLAEVVLN